ncbi:NADP-dependent oxidoreductase domain-containing protein [Syncephalastrum racemosum]|uniref:NADP-dependent oxidoreductase domain-containing protein n=1 Tax=Syncephalastrum racemosum TaxID=13706 RepID=A0A1X2HCN1_SYNRA|nr:NADP-dependent oxidoreductase domain-containing protein [Syncephalastrum racemosum]
MPDWSNTEMEYTRFGNTGMHVSRVCLGCMSYGSSEWAPWVQNEEESLKLIKMAYEAGINFFDTANVYSNGESERILGKAIRENNMERSRIVVATKVFFGVGKTPATHLARTVDNNNINNLGLSRKHIFDAVDASLKRLGLDYIDLYQIHRFDPNTPIEETMEALHDLVKSGKVRYIGASSMWAWQFQKANHVAEKNGWTKFVSMQNLYNLLYREEEREMLPYCVDQGIAVIPWSPLAMGLLAGKNRNTVRNGGGMKLEGEVTDKIIDKVSEMAQKKGVTPAQLSLAWIFHKPAITAPIVGMGKESHMQDVIAALKIKLTEEEIKSLEEDYAPQAIFGHQ